MVYPLMAVAGSVDDTERIDMHKVILYTLPDCPECDRVKEKLTSEGVEFEEKSAAHLTSGIEHDMEAMVQLATQGMAAPVMLVDGRGVDSDRFFEDIKGE